jgi:hypothetical protein
MTMTNNHFGLGREVDLEVFVYTRPHMRDEGLESMNCSWAARCW